MVAELQEGEQMLSTTAAVVLAILSLTACMVSPLVGACLEKKVVDSTDVGVGVKAARNRANESSACHIKKPPRCCFCPVAVLFLIISLWPFYFMFSGIVFLVYASDINAHNYHAAMQITKVEAVEGDNATVYPSLNLKFRCPERRTCYGSKI